MHSPDVELDVQNVLLSFIRKYLLREGAMQLPQSICGVILMEAG